MKRIALVIIAVAMVWGAGISTAQEGQVNVEFRITVSTDCPNATYWGLVGPPDSEFSNIQLSDSDGDGVYTGSTEVGAGDQWVVALVQGTGVADTVYGPAPGQPSRTIQDFGTVTITEDRTFEGSVSSCPSGLPPTGLENINLMLPLVGAVVLLATGIYIRQHSRQQA